MIERYKTFFLQTIFIEHLLIALHNRLYITIKGVLLFYSENK